jgi:hypothetical protein
MHQDALPLDPRGDIRVCKERVDDAAPRGSVLCELRPVQIKTDDDATLRRVYQRLGYSWVRQHVSRDIDGQLGAADLASIDILEVFSRRVVDLGLALSHPGPFLGPSRP